MVTVQSGANENVLQLSGQTVGQVRAAFASALNIAPSAVATINGERADNDHTLAAGDKLVFAKEVARKG